MEEFDLLTALNDVDDKYVLEASENRNHAGTGMKYKSVAMIVVAACIMALLIIKLSTFINQDSGLPEITGGEIIECQKGENASLNEKQSVIKNEGGNKVTLVIPTETTKLKIVDGALGDLIFLENESVSQFNDKLGLVSGVSKSIGDCCGYTYAVNCYHEEECIASFLFMTDCIVQESIGGHTKEITMDVANPAFAYIEELFEELRPKN